MGLESSIISALQSRSQTVAAAESCTGGLVAHRLTNVPGASAVFQEGVITYSNEVKTKLLGVPRALIETYGAVSAEVATAMAEGIQKKSGATFGLATTGIAGPSGGSSEKSVGTVFLAIAESEKPTYVWREFFPGERLAFKEKAAEILLQQFFLQIVGLRS